MNVKYAELNIDVCSLHLLFAIGKSFQILSFRKIIANVQHAYRKPLRQSVFLNAVDDLRIITVGITETTIAMLTAVF